jgi:3-oxoacyl-[acyl-carrier-protein] synthase-3
MKSRIGSVIAGTGIAVPPKVVSNEDLAKIMDTSDEWIRQRSGIEERRIAGPDASPSDLALESSMMALNEAGLSPADIDLIIVATLTPEHYFPGTSAYLQQKLGLTTTPAMDIRCQCSGFLYGLQTAQAMIGAGIYQRVLLSCVEIHSRALDFTTRGRDIAVLFGDGSGSVVLTASDERDGILATRVHAQGEHAEKLWLRSPACAPNELFMSHEAIDNGDMYPKMEGRAVFKHAVTRLPEVVAEALEAAEVGINDVDLFVFHQANLRINEAVMQLLGQPIEKSFNNIMRYGNCSAASIPMCLAEASRAGRLKRGDLVCIGSFGAGFTWGAALIRW